LSNTRRGRTFPAFVCLLTPLLTGAFCVRVLRMAKLQAPSRTKLEAPLNATMTVLTAHCAHYTLPPELVSNVFERHGCRLYVASLLGRIVGGWAANRQLFWLFFPGLVEAVSTSTRTTGLKTALHTAKPSHLGSTSRCERRSVFRYQLHCGHWTER
jgi:hypothetical protein